MTFRLFSVVAMLLFTLLPKLAMSCGSYQTCTAIFILEFDATPQYRAEGEPVHVSLHSFEFANWFSAVSTMTFTPIALGYVGARVIPGNTVQTSNQGPFAYGIFPSYWFVQNTEWDSTLDWDGLDDNGQEVTDPVLLTVSVNAGAASASRSVALFVASGKDLGKPNCPQGNPCNAATGNKYQEEIDLPGSELVPRLIRHYNHMAGTDTGLGIGWTSNYHKRLQQNGGKLTVVRADGRRERLTSSGAAWLPDADSHLRIVAGTTDFTLTTDTGTVETYSAAGKLIAETDNAGRTTNYGYDASGRLSSVIAPFGHGLTFAYNVGGRLETIVDSNQKTIRYGYDGNNNLIRVDYPDLTAKKYFYEDSNFPHYLTGLAYIDSAGTETRLATYGYDPSTGKATLTQHAQTDNASPQEKIVLAYDVPAANQTTVTDSVNTQEVISFASNLGVKNVVAKLNQGDGKSLRQSFDASNNLTCRKDEENRITLYAYNGTNQKTSMTEGLVGTDCNVCLTSPASCNTAALGRTTTYDYLAPTLDVLRFLRRPSVAAGQNLEIETVYGDLRFPNLPTQIIQRGFTPAGITVPSRTVTFSYNASGQVNRIDGPRTDVSDITTLDYDACNTGGACGQLRQITNALGHVTTYDLYDPNGRVTQLTDPNGLVTTYEYDPRGRVLFMRQTPPGGVPRVTAYRYTPFGAVQTVASPDGMTLTYNYDAAQYLRSVTDNLGNRVTYHYDVKGNRDGEEARDPDGTLVRTITYQSDLRNRLQSINAAGSITQLVFDALGNLRTETDPNNNPSTAHTPDPLNRLIQTIDRIGGQSTYNYDVNDRLIQVKSPNNASTQHVHDDLGNLLQEISLDRGTTTYTYDNAGNVKTITDARGVLSTYTYDALNRLTFLDYPGSEDDISFAYDSCAYGRGQRCQALTQGENLSYGYDAYGNVIDQNHRINNVNYVLHYSYDAGNRIKTITYPSGMMITYVRDAVGRIQDITRTVGGVTTAMVSNRTYRADGLLKNQIFGNSLPETRSHDLQGRRQSQGVGSVYARNYPLYDPNGNVQQLTATGFSGLYHYDSLDRLTQDNPSPGAVHVYDYDGNGNRSLDNTVPYFYSPNTNRLSSVGGTAVNYDATGNITQDNLGRTYTYDNAGRLKTSTVNGSTTTYSYNTFGQRTQKTRPNMPSVFYYSGPNGELLAETEGGGTPIVEYVYADQEPIAQIRYAPDPGSPGAPTITGFWPGAGAVNSVVFVFGSGFVSGIGATTVKINGIDAPIMQVLSSDLLLFLLPAGNTNGPILVSTAGGSTSTGSVYFGAPLTGLTLTGIWPAQGPVNTVVFLFGSGFIPNQTQVSFNQTQTFLVQVLDPSLTLAIVPPGTGTGPIQVTTAQGSVLSTTPFTVTGSVPVGGTVTYLHADHLGTPRVGTDQNGSVVWRWEGGACGDTLPTGSITMNLRFAGQHYDSETGLHYNWHRYYDPKTCRYNSSDPIGLPGGLNTYVYVGGNPLRYTDPLGLSPVGIVIGVGVRVIGGRAAATAIGAFARQYGPVGLATACVLAGVCTFNESDETDDSAEPKPDREQKPEGCPVGTKPVDKDKRLDRGKIHGIKDQIGAGPRDWVGISPDGRIWTNESGRAVDNGPFTDYLP